MLEKTALSTYTSINNKLSVSLLFEEYHNNYISAPAQIFDLTQLNTIKVIYLTGRWLDTRMLLLVQL